MKDNKFSLLKIYLLSYYNITLDLLFNFFNIKNATIYKENLQYSNVLQYNFSALIIVYIIIFIPFIIFSKINGSIDIFIFFIKNILILSLVSLSYAIPIYILKKEFLWKKIFLLLLLASSLYLPFYSLTSLPMLLNISDLHINLFLGGDKTLEFNPISKNYYLLLLTVIIGFLHMLLAPIIIPTIWLSQSLNIKWRIMLLIILVFSNIPSIFIKYINPIILDYTHYINDILGVLPF